jgi:energy-coupling factor transporter ATP-binding protein EcfA2
MAILDEILDWSRNIPAWQSDAMRRIWVKIDLSVQDVSEILMMIKSEYGLIDASTKVISPIRLSKTHMAITASDKMPVILKSMRDVKNVNALVENQTINFNQQGITVIYGENATGKSGYSRVLKKACKTRGEPEGILPNIHAPHIPSASAEAIFDVISSGVESQLHWVDSTNEPEQLREIAVFDSKSARVYIEEQNKVVYIPYGLDVFTRLAELCLSLKGKMQQEIDNLDKKPEIIEKIVGDDKIIKELDHRTDFDQIRNIASFTDKDEARLVEIKRILATIQADDPQAKARSLERLRARINAVRQEIIEKTLLLRDIAIADLRKSWKEMKVAEEAARMVSDKSFADEPLAGVGSDVWREMFLAAKRYSEECAYPVKIFPVTDRDSRCLLCQQLLDYEAKVRLKRFWDFIQEETSRRSEEKKATYEKKHNDIISENYEVKDEKLLEELQEWNPDGYALLKDYIASMALRSNSLRELKTDENWDNLPILARSPYGLLSRFSRSIAEEERKFSEIAKPEEKNKLDAEYKSLETRKLGHENLDKIEKYLESLKKKHKLDQCISACATTGITRKRTELMNQVITRDLKNALEYELRNLGAAHLRFELEPQGKFGETYLQLRISEVSVEGVDINQVLSEGEQRLVAIASFLAELSVSETKCGIVFDDPVCSLDHKWREKFAERIVGEAANRQVIIFTHDIVLLLAINRQCAEQQAAISTQAITRFADSIGVCDQEIPTPAMNVSKRIGHLKKLHQEIDKFYRSDDKPRYEFEVGHLYDLLRACWERAVEEVLFADVVQRYRPEIETQKLRKVSIKPDDYRTIYFAMKKCSETTPAHDEPAASLSALPSPDEVGQDILKLERFVRELRKRQVYVDAAQRESIQPPKFESA